ncbi:MAG: NTP transferase domain-containing protein [Spirochaetaceae bacterium]|jgi:spore coat polysaccharide biosynthesis protein SpsF|nr:NTP transferase domain-containing protein [Spirochaetaceae bacterium]
MEDAPMTALILQARLDSSRLPRKALLPLDGEPVLFRVLEALSSIPCDEYILACPDDSFDAFSPIARRAGFALFAGSKQDVLSRYCSAIRHFGLNKQDDARIIRATGDNPFVFADAAATINNEAAMLGADYAAYAGLPHGAGIESVAASALLRAEREARAAPEREHVCPYLYADGNIFSLHRPLAPKEWQSPELRITIDTQEDYERAMTLFTTLSKNVHSEKRYSGAEVIKVVRGE